MSSDSFRTALRIQESSTPTTIIIKAVHQGQGLIDSQGKDWRVPNAQLPGNAFQRSGPPLSARVLVGKERPMGVSVHKHD